MMSTVIVIALFLGLLLGTLLLWVVFLRLGLRWAKVEDATTHRIAVATILVVVLQVAYTVVSHLGSNLLPPGSVASVLLLPLVDLGAGVIIPCLVIKRVFAIPSLRVLLVWLTTLLANAIMLAFLLLVFQPFVLESFQVAANSMAPTLLGTHSVGTCVECGGPAYCTPVPRDHVARETPQMICRDSFHVSQPTDYNGQEGDGDRILAVKYIKPQRWDLIVFRFSEDPSIVYIKRLVGLPGEEITIQDGQVFADGQVLTPPDSIKGIKYLSEEMPYWGKEVWGSPDHPAKLADDEYFVLGDFSQTSKDSRLWRLGSSGHNPYAVPESHLLGVVTHIYWPPSRWRVFR